MADEDLAGAERMSVGAAGGWLGDPLPSRRQYAGDATFWLYGQEIPVGTHATYARRPQPPYGLARPARPTAYVSGLAWIHSEQHRTRPATWGI